MQKITSILLQGTVFNIEESAYKMLDVYLKSIKKHFSKFQADDEIVSDIENRIAEKFTTEILTAKHKTITDTDVESLITSMGTVAEITETEENLDVETQRLASPEFPTPSPKRLYRDTDNAVIAGVASGIASYFNLSPILVRLIFLASLIPGGTGVLIYIILWIITPEAKTPTQKMEMQGDSITLASLEKNIKEGVDKIPPTSPLIRRFFQMIAAIITAIVGFIAKILKPIIRIFGGLITFALTFALVGLTIAAIMFLLNLHHPYLDDPSREFISTINGLHQHVFVWSGYFTALVPLVIIFLTALSVALWRNMFKTPLVLALAAIWLIAITTLGVEAIRFGPTLQAKAAEIESRLERQDKNSRITQAYPITKFTELQINGFSNVNLQTGPEFSAIAEGQPDYLNSISINQQSNTLSIDTKPKNQNQHKICFFHCNNRPVFVTVTVPNIETITVSDFSRLMTSEDTTFEIEQLNFTIEDHSQAELDLVTSNLNLTILGFSSVRIEGQVATLSAEISDNSNLEMHEADTTYATVSARDFSSVEINVLQSLTATARDLSHITYHGSPNVVTTDSDEMSSIRPVRGIRRGENTTSPAPTAPSKPSIAKPSSSTTPIPTFQSI